jgi:hypothetical protein
MSFRAGHLRLLRLVSSVSFGFELLLQLLILLVGDLITAVKHLLNGHDLQQKPNGVSERKMPMRVGLELIMLLGHMKLLMTINEDIDRQRRDKGRV